MPETEEQRPLDPRPIPPPDAEDPPTQRGRPAPRPSLGPGYDWLLELMRQVPRPLLFAIIVAAILRNLFFATAAQRLDPLTFQSVLGFAALLCGIRGAEMVGNAIAERLSR